MRIALLAACVSLLLASRAAAQAGVWVTEAPLPTPKGVMTSAAVGGKVYAITGACVSTLCNENLAYDPETDMWTAKAPILTPRFSASSAVSGGLIYVIGGAGDRSFVFADRTAEAYDPKTDTWSAKPPIPTGRTYAATGVIDGVIYVASGNNSLTNPVPIATVEAFDPGSGLWTAKAPMPTPRLNATSGVIDGIFYVVGGASSSGLSPAIEAYDPKTDAWTEKSPIPAPTFPMAAGGVLDGRLYVVGVTGNFPNGTPVAFAYDPKTDSWSTVTPPPTARWGAGSGVVGDTLYVFGGVTADGPTAVNEAFTPFLMVSIDIKPGDRTNTINLGSHGVLPVAILGSATFDAMTVDPTTVTLAGAHVASRGGDARVAGQPRLNGDRVPSPQSQVPALMTGQSDVNNDGYPDLLLYFRTQDLTALQPSPTPDSPSVDGPGGRVPNPESQRVAEAVLYGTTYSGRRIRGSDAVRIVPAVQVTTTNRPRPQRGRRS